MLRFEPPKTSDDILNILQDAQAYLDYVNVMRVFYSVMGVFRSILFVVVLCYTIQNYYRKYKLSWFQTAVIWVIQILTLTQSIYQYMWNASVIKKCELWSRNMEALIDVCMFVIGILCTFFLFQTITSIYKFATKGMLPKETARKRMVYCVVLIVVCSVTILIAFCWLNIAFTVSGSAKGIK